jgi:adenylate kinase
MLREEISKETDLAHTIERYLNKGELVPDFIVNKIVETRLKQPDVSEGFILDGFPRSISQAKALDKILSDLGVSLDQVIYVEVDDETIINRLSKRRICPECGAVYHLEDKPPRKPGICDLCGSELQQRSDDVVIVIRHRLKVYREETEPLLERYRKRGKVKKISGDMPFDQISLSLRRILDMS